MPDGRESLKQIAARARVTTRPAMLIVRGGRDYFTVRCSFKSDDFRIAAYANTSQLYVVLNGDSGVVFSTPRQDPDLNVTSLLGQVAGRDVYMNGQGLGSPLDWIYGSDAVAALTSIEIGEEERLTVALNGLSALLLSAGGDADWERLRRLVALARVLPRGLKQAQLDRGLLPEDLRDLFFLLKRWGIPDDEERSAAVTSAKTETLERLVERAETRLARISAFLSETHGDSAEATALDGLAQSVMEARQELNRRWKKHPE